MTAPSPAFVAATQSEERTADVWHWLFELNLETDTTEDLWVLLCDHDEDVSFRGLTYHAYPVALESVDGDAAGDLPETSLVLSNLHGYAATLLRTYGGLMGRRVVARLVTTTLLADQDDCFSVESEVIEATASRDTVTLALGQHGLHDLQFPLGRYQRTTCRFRYVTDGRGRCGNTDTTSTTCSRNYDDSNGCTSKGNEARFGGFPAIPGVGP